MDVSRIFGLLVGFCVVSAAVCPAETLTWIGADDASFSAAENWRTPSGGNAAPQSGDTLVFNNTGEKTLTCTESFDIGADGLTIDAATSGKKLYLSVRFTGVGKLTKKGAGYLYLKANPAGTWSGGTDIMNGFLYGGVQSQNHFLGSGTVAFVPESTTTYPSLRPGAWNGITITNRVEVQAPEGWKSPASNPVVYSSNGGSALGPWFSNSDFALSCGSGSGAFSVGSISAPGKTVYLSVSSSNSSREFRFNGSIDAHVDIMSRSAKEEPHRRIVMAGVSTNEANTLTIRDGTNQFATSTAYWGGTNIVIQPAGNSRFPRLKLRAAGNINSNAVISIWTGGIIDLASSGIFRVRGLIVDGEAVDPGLYDRTSFTNGVLVGTGVLQVGETSVLWTGAGVDAQLWNDPANWSPQRVPSVGDTVLFTQDATITDEMTLPEGFLTINVAADRTLWLSNNLAGAVSVVKTGAGTLRGFSHVYTGGTTLKDGTLLISSEGLATAYRGSVLMPGTGPIEICRNGIATPLLRISSWINLTNDVRITGQAAVGQRDMYFNNEPSLLGRITSDGDLLLHNQYNNKGRQVDIVGDIDAHGHVLRLTGRNDPGYPDKELQTAMGLSGNVDASLEKGATMGPVVISGRLVDEGASCTFYGGTNVVSASGYIACTNVLIDSATKSACLRFVSSTNLNPQATLRLANGGKLVLDKNVRIVARELFVDDQMQAPGYYSSVSHSDLIVGEGRLRVGPPMGTVIIAR